MKLCRLNHVGIATPDLDSAIAFHRDVLGADDITTPAAMPEHGVRVCFVNLPGGGAQIELLEPFGENSPLRRFLDRNPAGGQHHLCFEVPDIAAARAWFDSQKKRVLGPTRIGAHGTPVFFLHPKDMNGILTEIMEAPPHG